MVRAALSKAFGFLKRVFGRYEAAVTRWGDRSLLFSALQDARLDISTMVRQELQRKHRYWVQNSSLVNRIRNLFIQFSVGVGGLQVVPNAGDEDETGDSEAWNKSRKSSWEAWWRSPEANSNITGGQLCIQWAGGLFDDGEIFIHKLAINGRPALETIEAHRVCTPTVLQNSQDVIDGVKYARMPNGGIGKPLAYYVMVSKSPELPTAGVSPTYPGLGANSPVWDEIPARDMIHVFKARRPGQLRGIPEGFSGMNTLHDYEDLHLLEMQAAKLASQIGLVETNPTGEIDTQATRRARVNIQSQNQNAQPVIKPGDQFYNVTLGAQKIALKSGDSLQNFMVNRPTVAQENYWDLLISQICCSYNVPKLLVVPYSLQGTVTRADLDICANAFRANFEIIAWALQQVYEWQTMWAVNYDRSMDGDPPADFLECIIRPPRPPNVDIGYTAQALQIELQMGTKTLQDVYAERQQDWRHQVTQIAETIQFINQTAEKYGVDAAQISQLLVEQAEPQEEAGGESQQVNGTSKNTENA